MAAPLTKEHLDMLNNMLKTAKDIKPEIARAKSVGLDVFDLEEKILADEKKAALFKQVYFPSGRA
tara:strand:- start:396 stop:590 length:195 start_codon:yes stop_codon:yes gene_type:complete